jgi:hypothetical protein
MPTGPEADAPAPSLLDPPADRPYSPQTRVAFARHYDLTPTAVDQLVAEGLPLLPDGTLDPFAACNHLTWYARDRVPALARRWQSYRAWFGNFVAGRDVPHRLRWHRRHRLYLPPGVRDLDWYLPRPRSLPGQQEVLAEDAPTAAGCRTTRYATHHGLASATVAAPVMATGAVDLALQPRRVLPSGAAEHTRLVEVLRSLLSDWRYGYRHHLPHGLEDDALAASPVGSCLDCAALSARALRAAGWRCELMGGIVAYAPIANPHFWLEVETGAGPTPVDPSLPVIARLLGEDWRPWLDAYIGGVDARRILLARGPSPVAGIPGGSAFSLACGEAIVTDAVGRRRNAWRCIDWVCGECVAEFEPLA